MRMRLTDKAVARFEAGAAALQTLAPQHVIEAVLKHLPVQVSGSASVYNVYNYAKEVADALVRWSAPVEAPRALSSPCRRARAPDAERGDGHARPVWAARTS